MKHSDRPIDYDISVGDLVIILDNVDLFLSSVYSQKICIVIAVFPSNTNVVFNFELRIMTAEGHRVDVWYHEVRKIGDSNVQ